MDIETPSVTSITVTYADGTSTTLTPSEVTFHMTDMQVRGLSVTLT
ncbi:hypothetical protein ACIQTT_01755 [Microbacterium sp. NPDC090225]